MNQLHDPASSAATPARRMHRNRTVLWGGVAAAAVVVVIAAAAAVLYMREQAELRASSTTQNLARSMELSLEGMIATIDVGLQASADEISRQRAAGRADAASVNAYLERQRERMPHVAFLSGMNERGEVEFGPGVFSIPLNNADRDYLLHLRDNPSAGLFIAAPLFGQITQKWFWLLARRVGRPDGSFGGVVLAVIEIDAIRDMLAKIRMGPGGSIALRDGADRLIARHALEATDPISTGDVRLSGPFRDALQADPREGTFVSDTSSVDSVSRTYSYRRNPRYGFLVNVGVSRESVLAEWHRQAAIVALLAAVFVLAAVIYALLIGRAWRRQKQDLAALALSINARERAETLLRTRLRFAELAQAGSVDELLQQVLDVAEEVTGSQIGFFHFVDPDQETLTLQAWSTNTLAHMCTAEGKGQHYAVSLAGVWADAFHARAPVIHNDYPGLAHRKGLPEGHAPVTRELVVPIIRAGKVTEIIGVGNKAEDYDDADVQALQVVAEMVQDVMDRIRAEAKVRTLSRAVEQSPASIVITDRRGDIEYVNPRFEQVSGYTREEALGRNPRILKSGVVPGETYAQLWKTIAAGGEWRGELCNRRRNGELYWEFAAISGLKDEHGEVSHYIAVKEDITERKRAEESARQANEQLRQLTVRLNTMHEAESRVLSRELHDEFGQLLSSLKMDLSWIALRLGEGNPELKRKVASSMDLVDASVRSVHSIAARLRPRILDELGLLPAIDWLVQDFRERSGIDTEFVANAKVTELAPEQATAVFRIVQESLSNIARHAEAKCVDVSLDLEASWVVVEVRDDGRGLSENEVAGYESIGLLGMRERALAAGGEIAIRSVMGKGTVVTLRLPAFQESAS